MKEGAAALQHIIMTHPLLSLTSTQGLTLGAAVRTSWLLRCGEACSLVGGVLCCDGWFVLMSVTAMEPHCITRRGCISQTIWFSLCKADPCFFRGYKRRWVQVRQVPIREAVKWQYMLSDAKTGFRTKSVRGGMLQYCDGSRKQTLGLSHAGLSVWFRAGDARNEDTAVPVLEKRSATRANVRAVLVVFSEKQPGVPLPLVTDSEPLCLGLQGKCAKWHGLTWALAHVDLWSSPWDVGRVAVAGRQCLSTVGATTCCSEGGLACRQKGSAGRKHCVVCCEIGRCAAFGRSWGWKR